MAYVAIEISSSKSIATLNDKCQNAGNPREALNKLIDLLSGIASGTEGEGVTVQVTVKDATSSISTSGTGSSQNSYTLS